MSYEDDNYIILEDQNGHSNYNNNNNSPSSSLRNLSPSNDRRDRNRSRSRSYDDRRRSGGSNGNGHRSRSPRRSRSPHSRERDRTHRRSPMRSSGSSRSTAQLDRELGLKYRWEKTVYVSNIPYDTRWTDLKDLFRDKVGDIMYCEVFEKDSKSLGVAAIEFKTVEDAERAVQVMHQYELGGRKISCRIDNEGYKTRQAKEQALEGHHHSSNNKSSSNSNNDSNQVTAASTLALAQTLATLTGGGLNSNANILGLLGLGTNPIVQQQQQQTPSGLLGTFGGANPNANQTNLLNQLAAQLKVDGPVTNRIFIASLDYKVDENKINEVFALAGKVLNVSLFKDREGKSRGMAVVEYDTPFEALNAVSMFNNQQLLDRQMTVRFDTKPPRDDESNSKNSSNSSKLPSGLKSIGTGIGLAGLLGSANNIGLGALGALGQSNDLSALSNLGLNLNGTAPSLMSGLLGSNGSSGLLGLSNLNGSRSSNGNSNNSISKIFVKNIPFSWDERKLKEKFRQAGHIEYVEIKQKDGKSRGCGLIR